jgi:predicted GIY-YIG superfamily endonuclease
MSQRSGHVYKIVNRKDDKIYIGSTMGILTARMAQHRKHARDGQQTSDLYNHMRKVGIHHFTIELLLTLSINSRQELVKTEYEEMAKRKASRLLNMNTVEGKLSEEHKAKLLASQMKHREGYRGLISQTHSMSNGKYPCTLIKFSWSSRKPNELRKRHYKAWSIQKYGLNEALRLSEVFRNSIYPL